jgi:hypothetical protein
MQGLAPDVQKAALIRPVAPGGPNRSAAISGGLMSRAGITRRVPWIEVVLIVFSVFIAVALESWWDERQDVEKARVVLSQVRDELRQDRSDLQEVIEEQDARAEIYEDLGRWFAEIESAPLDSVGDWLDSLAWSNRTMWPRRAGWSTMIAGNQLELLNAPELVASLGNIYETVNVRLRSNSESYGRAVEHLIYQTLPPVWNPRARVFVASEPTAVSTLRGELHLVHHSWTEWYRFYLREYGASLDSMIEEVEAYLSS